jgi:hypothetical protein
MGTFNGGRILLKNNVESNNNNYKPKERCWLIPQNINLDLGIVGYDAM